MKEKDRYLQNEGGEREDSNDAIAQENDSESKEDNITNILCSDDGSTEYDA